jgi:hypothetical protein
MTYFGVKHLHQVEQEHTYGLCVEWDLNSLQFCIVTLGINNTVKTENWLIIFLL